MKYNGYVTLASPFFPSNLYATKVLFKNKYKHVILVFILPAVAGSANSWEWFLISASCYTGTGSRKSVVRESGRCEYRNHSTSLITARGIIIGNLFFKLQVQVQRAKCNKQDLQRQFNYTEHRCRTPLSAVVSLEREREYQSNRLLASK